MLVKDSVVLATAEVVVDQVLVIHTCHVCVHESAPRPRVCAIIIGLISTETSGCSTVMWRRDCVGIGCLVIP